MDASFHLDRNVWNGAVEPRLVLRNVWGCARGPIEVLGEPADYLAAVLEEIDRAPAPPAPADPAAARGHSEPRRHAVFCGRIWNGAGATFPA